MAPSPSSQQRHIRGKSQLRIIPIKGCLRGERKPSDIVVASRPGRQAGSPSSLNLGGAAARGNAPGEIGVGTPHCVGAPLPPNRTGGLPASGSSVDGVTCERIDRPEHGRWPDCPKSKPSPAEDPRESSASRRHKSRFHEQDHANARTSFKTAGDWLILRSPRSKMCLSPFRRGFETGSNKRDAGASGCTNPSGPLSLMERARER